ncbi:MAG: hypothetical protein Phog2KO_49690 [Phototrophicaceae bacterium]
MFEGVNEFANISDTLSLLFDLKVLRYSLGSTLDVAVEIVELLMVPPQMTLVFCV